jgi:hypothetical protein
MATKENILKKARLDFNQDMVGVNARALSALHREDLVGAHQISMFQGCGSATVCDDIMFCMAKKSINYRFWNKVGKLLADRFSTIYSDGLFRKAQLAICAAWRLEKESSLDLERNLTVFADYQIVRSKQTL